MPSIFVVRDGGSSTSHFHTGGENPRAGRVISALLSMFTIVLLSILLSRRISATPDWKKVPLTRWLTFVIYTLSIIFITASTVIDRGFGLNSTFQVCDASILLCLTCYLTTKALLFFFLIEKVHIIQKVRTSRIKSPLFMFNCFGLLLPYCGVIALNFVFRVAVFNEDGICVIGMENVSVMPLIIMDAVINFYLTMLFVMPLRKLYSYNATSQSSLRTITFRSFIGSCATLTSSVVNLTVLMVLKGEQSWICLMLCNADVLFSVVVLHWVTSKDSTTDLSKHSYDKDGTGNLGTSNLRSTKGAFADGLRSQVDRTVTTRITAVGHDPDSDGEDSVELKKIRVQVEHTHTVERGSSGGTSNENAEYMGRINHRSE